MLHATTSPAPRSGPKDLAPAVGTEAWVRATGGNLTTKQRRAFLPALLRAQVANAMGRTAMATGRHAGRRAQIAAEVLTPPDSALARDAEAAASELLSPALLHHSHRSFAWAAAIAALDDIAFDRELLFVAAMLHDAGLPTPTGGTDFTARSVDVLEQRGLAATLTPGQRQIVGDAICAHHSPGAQHGDGAERYLLSMGTGIDVLGLRTWDLPGDLQADVLRTWPRVGFKREFRALWLEEARLVPQGRAAFLNRYGAFRLAIKLAPFES